MWTGQSSIALVAMLMVIPVAFGLMFLSRPVAAVIIVFVGGALMLPENATFELTSYAIFDKDTLPVVALILAALVRCPGRILKLPREKWVWVLIILMVGGSAMTGVTNGEPLAALPYAEPRPGLSAKDGLAIGIRGVIRTVLPFLLARAMFKSSRDLRTLLEFLVLFMCFYSLFILVEVRMSPQMHRWVYGYHVLRSFSQVYRWGGFRPNVFTHHGLELAMIVAITVAAAVALARARRSILTLPAALIAAYLVVILVFCRSTGAAIWGIILLSILLFSLPRTWVRFGALFAAISLGYPLLCALGLFPHEGLVAIAEWIDPDRAQSLQFRFYSEDVVLSRTVEEKPWFGWGFSDRNLGVDRNRDRRIILDGFWIISFSSLGASGFLAAFGLLTMPVFSAARRFRRIADPRVRRLFAALALMVGVWSCELLLNGRYDSLPYFLSGALTGLASGLPLEARRASLEGVGRGPARTESR